MLRHCDGMSVDLACLPSLSPASMGVIARPRRCGLDMICASSDVCSSAGYFDDDFLFEPGGAACRAESDPRVLNVPGGGVRIIVPEGTGPFRCRGLTVSV